MTAVKEKNNEDLLSVINPTLKQKIAFDMIHRYKYFLYGGA